MMGRCGVFAVVNSMADRMAGQAGTLFFDILMGSAAAKAMAGQARLRKAYSAARKPAAETGEWLNVR